MAKKLPKIISQEEFEKLLKAEKKKEFRLAYLLGFEAGMRISEIVGLPGRIEPLSKEQIEGGNIRIIRGKGAKDRIVPKPKRMTEKAIAMLPLKIPRRTLQGRITRLGEKVLNKHITFHTLRHGFCSHLANSGMQLHQVQMLAGHSNLQTTGIYLHANPKQAIEKAQELF